MSPRLRVAVLTPPGRSAVASVRVEGTGAAELVRQRFFALDGGLRKAFALGRVLYGRWGGVEGEEIVVCRRPLRRLAEGEAIEIHCHGGDAAVQVIVQSLVDLGAQAVPVQELRSLEIDHLQALPTPPPASRIASEARFALSQATTLRTASILLEQWAGALQRELAEIGRLLLSSPGAATERLGTLLLRAPLGLHLTRPWRVVLAGRPNVGKSSLTNALLGYERAIVFDQPGTTRDVVTASAVLDGWPVELTDTAGLRTINDASGDGLEAAGIAKALEQVAAADLLVLVFDVSQPWREEDQQLCRRWPQAVVVRNKRDLVADDGTAAGNGDFSVATSTVTGEGIQELARHLAARLVPHAPPAGAAVPFTDRQSHLLEEALAAARGGDGRKAGQYLVEISTG
jgi:tRNA modification GTPase